MCTNFGTDYDEANTESEHALETAMRIRYVSDPANFPDPHDQAIESRIRQRRGADGLIPLDRALLHSPPVADGW